MRSSIIMTVVLFLAACATGGPTRTEAEQAYFRHAGPDLERVRYNGFIQGWKPVGNDSVLMSFSRDTYYLLELSPPCNMELRQAIRIALKTSSRQAISKFDRLQVGDVSCRITGIREVDYEAAQAELQEQNDQSTDFERTVEHETEPDEA